MREIGFSQNGRPEQTISEISFIATATVNQSRPGLGLDLN
jgi:hypothetical protein